MNPSTVKRCLVGAVLAIAADPVAPPAAPEPVPGKAVATAQTRAPATAAEQLDDQLQPSTGQWIQRIRDLVQGADSLEQIRDGLERLLPDMSLEQYAEVMAQALAAAALQGRVEILQEATGGR